MDLFGDHCEECQRAACANLSASELTDEDRALLAAELNLPTRWWQQVQGLGLTDPRIGWVYHSRNEWPGAGVIAAQDATVALLRRQRRRHELSVATSFLVATDDPELTETLLQHDITPIVCFNAARAGVYDLGLLVNDTGLSSIGRLFVDTQAGMDLVTMWNRLHLRDIDAMAELADAGVRRRELIDYLEAGVTDYRTVVALHTAGITGDDAQHYRKLAVRSFTAMRRLAAAGIAPHYLRVGRRLGLSEAELVRCAAAKVRSDTLGYWLGVVIDSVDDLILCATQRPYFRPLDFAYPPCTLRASDVRRCFEVAGKLPGGDETFTLHQVTNLVAGGGWPLREVGHIWQQLVMGGPVTKSRVRALCLAVPHASLRIRHAGDLVTVEARGWELVVCGERSDIHETYAVFAGDGRLVELRQQWNAVIRWHEEITTLPQALRVAVPAAQRAFVAAAVSGNMDS